MRFLYLSSLFVSGLFLCLSCAKKQDSPPPPTPVPAVSTIVVTNVTNNSATSGGFITDAGTGNILARGVCWSVNQIATVENNKTVDAGNATTYMSTMTNLLPNKLYYYRAYLTDGNGTVYGDELTFTTDALASVIFESKKVFVCPTDHSLAVTWGPDSVSTNATFINDGSANTNLIIQKPENYAAKICADLVSSGFSDWYLPSRQELEELVKKKATFSLKNQKYWSSTETGLKTAASQDGGTGAINLTAPKTELNYCRCVRRN